MATVSVVHGKGRHIQKESKENEKHWNGSKTDLSVANGNRNIISSGSSEHAMDDYLKKLDLYRKPVAKDGSCLFRVIAEQVYNTQERHLDVRRECIQFMQQNRSLFEAFVEGSFDHHLHQLRNSREWGDQVEILALSMLYKCDFVVYQAVDQEPQEVTCNGFEKKILLCFSNGNHYDAVYPASFRSNAAFVQAILYDHLLTSVFPVLPDHEEEQSLIADVPSETFAGNGSVESGWTEVKTKQKGAKSIDDPDPIIAAIPDAANNKDIYWQIKRSLDPGNYRNIELEVWNTSRADQQKQDHVVAVAMQFKVGDSCLARLRDRDSGEQLHNVKIEEICEDNHLYSVSGPGLKGRVSVPLADLQPLVMGDAFDESYKSWPGYYNKNDVVRDGEFHAQKRRGRGGRRTREEARKGEGGGTRLGRGTAESGRRDRAGFHGRSRPGRQDGERRNKESTDVASRHPPEDSVTSDSKSEDSSEPVVERDMASPSHEKAPGSSDGSLGNDQPQKVALSSESPAAFWGRMRSSAAAPLPVRDGISVNNLAPSQVADQGKAKFDQSVDKTDPVTPTENAPDAVPAHADALPIAHPMSHVPGMGPGQSSTVHSIKTVAAAKQQPSAAVHTKSRVNVGHYSGSPIMEIGVPSKATASKARSESAKTSLVSPTATAASVNVASAATTSKASAAIPLSVPTASEELKGQRSISTSKPVTMPASSADAQSLDQANARVVKAGEHIATSAQVSSVVTSDYDVCVSAGHESSPNFTPAPEFSFIAEISVGSSGTDASGCTSDSLVQGRAEDGDTAHGASDQSTASTVPQHVRRNEKHFRNGGVAHFKKFSNSSFESDLAQDDRASDFGLTACSTLPYGQEFVPRTGSVARKPAGQERSHSHDSKDGDEVEFLPSPMFNPSTYTASPDAFGAVARSEYELRGESVPEEIVALPSREREKSKKKVSFNLTPEPKGKSSHSNLQAAQVPVQSEPGKIVLPQEHMEKHMSELAAMQSQEVSMSPQIVAPQSPYMQTDVACYAPFPPIISVAYPSVDHLSFPQPSRDPEGKDLPEDREVLRFFYNLGVQLYYASMQTQQHPQAGIFPSQPHGQGGIFSYPIQQQVAVQHFRPLPFTPDQSSAHAQSQTIPQMSPQLPESFVPVNQLADSHETDLLLPADDRLLPGMASASHPFHLSSPSPLANLVGPSSHESGYDYPPTLRRAMTSQQTAMHAGHQGPRVTSCQRSYSGGLGIMGPRPGFLSRSETRHNPQVSNRLNYPMNGQYHSSSFSHR